MYPKLYVFKSIVPIVTIALGSLACASAAAVQNYCQEEDMDKKNRQSRNDGSDVLGGLIYNKPYRKGYGFYLKPFTYGNGFKMRKYSSPTQ